MLNLVSMTPLEPGGLITTLEMRNHLWNECERMGSIRAWAKANGISETQVQWTINGRREPSFKVLKALGYHRVNMYRRSS